MDSSSILFKDGQFEDVSKIRKAFCWKYFLLDEENYKAKCKVKFVEGVYCDRVLSARGSNGCAQATPAFKKHLKDEHAITPARNKVRT